MGLIAFHVTAALLIAANVAAAPYRTKRTHDPFHYVTRTRTVGNVLVLRGAETGVQVGLDAEVIEKEGAKAYRLLLDYRGARALSIAPGASLVLLADGERIELSDDGGPARVEVLPGGAVAERAAYPVGRDQLRVVTHARSVRVRVLGADRSYDGRLTPETARNLRRFYDAHARPAAPVPGLRRRTGVAPEGR